MGTLRNKLLTLREQEEAAFIPFLTLGDPSPEQSRDVLEAVSPNVDIIEAGFPFSDPIADGPRVQNAVQRSLEAGTTVSDGFNILNSFLDAQPEQLVCLLIYYNLIHRLGEEAFLSRSSETGVDGILAVDLPPEESRSFSDTCRKHDVEQIFIVAPTTDPERLDQILDRTTGFVYAVAVLGVTGERSTFQHQTAKLIDTIRQRSELPVCVGFGISRPEHVRQAVDAGADGVISGSAVISHIENNLDAPEQMLKELESFTRKMKQATKR